MKKNILPFILLVTLFFVQRSGFAESIGTEITYKSTATPGIYEVTLIIYRSCDNIALCGGSCSTPCTQTLVLMGADSGYTSANYGNFIVTLQNVRDISNNIQYCASSKNTCNNRGCETAGSFTTGFERYEFKGFANIGTASGIPANCCNIRFVYNMSCCRLGIQTIPASSGDAIYQDAIVNRCLSVGINNSSPVFTNDPLYMTCGGENVTYNNGLVDPDGDSLSVSFAPALKGYNSSVTYIAPFSYNLPISWTGNITSEYPGGIRCDPLTGDVMFTPANASSQDFNGLLTFKCEQWRKIGGIYKLLGTVRRECAITVLANCAPNNSPRLITNPPSASNPNAPNTFWETMAGQQLCFTVTAKDTDVFLPTVSDTTVLTWNQSLAGYGATFLPVYSGNRSVTGPREDTYQFCWTPQESFASSVPYQFMVSAADKRCPSNGKLSKAFSVKVITDPKPFLTQKTITCNSVSLQFALLNSLATGTGLVWAIANDTNTLSFDTITFYPANVSVPISHSFSKPGKYFVRMYAIRSSGASQVLLDSVQIAPFNLKDSITVTSPACYGLQNGSITAVGENGTPPYMFAMNNDTVFRPSGSFTALTAGTYRVTIKDTAGCIATDTMVLSQPPKLQSTLQFSKNTCDTFGLLNVTATGGTAGYVYRFNQGPFQPVASSLVVVSGKYRVFVKDSNQCVQEDSMEIALPQPLQQTLLFSKNACDSFAKLSIQASGGKIPYRYQLNETAFQPAPLFNIYQSGKYVITLKDSNNCLRQDSIPVIIPEAFHYGFIKKDISCFWGSDGGITFHARGGNVMSNYQYSMSNPSQQNTTGQFNNLSAGMYTFSIKDDSNCTLWHTEHWENPPQITLSPISGDSVVALNSNRSYSVVHQPGRKYHWQVKKGVFIGNTATQTVTVKWDSTGTGLVSVLIEDSNRCFIGTSMEVAIGSVGLNEFIHQSDITLFPNPTHNVISVSVEVIPENNTLSVYDLQGRLLLQQELKHTQELNLQELPVGMYIIKVGDWFGKVVKQ